MGFWTRVFGTGGVTPNSNPPEAVTPGDPDGVDVSDFENLPEARSLPWIQPSTWSGYPANWNTPAFNTSQQRQMNNLIDLAWACADLNTNVLATMPVYRIRNGAVKESTTWMNNPDPTIYSSWQEFAKQLFWDYQVAGEVFILSMARDSSGYPIRFRVIPPWMVNVEMVGGVRAYTIGRLDVTDDILHIRYKSTTDGARGMGPLDAAGARIVSIGLLQRYANNLAETGGVPMYWLSTDRKITPSEGRDLLEAWIESRAKYPGQPAIVGSGATLNQAANMNAKDMALMELSQFNESRIAVLMGVPPFLVGLAGATGSLTYSNISDLFDFHDRSSLRPKARAVMEALSEWVLPRGQEVELNRDDYTRLPLDKRANAYKTMVEIGVLDAREIRGMERYLGENSAQALTGADTIDDPVDSNPPTPPVASAQPPAQPQRMVNRRPAP